MIRESTIATLRNYDWDRAKAAGLEMAYAQVKAGQEVAVRDVYWALLREAAQVSAISYTGPPRQSLPSKSTMPEAPDEVSQWQLMSAYLKGDLEEMPPDQSRPPMPSAAEITRADMVLQVWHLATFRGKGDWKRMRKAVYMRACGVPPRKITAVTGFSRQRLNDAKHKALDDMAEFVLHLDKRTKCG